MSKARFRRIPKNGKSSFTIMSTRCHNAVAQKCSIALNILHAVRSAMEQEDVDMVVGDFNGASWRSKSGPDEQFDNALEALRNARHPVPPSSSPLWDPGGIPSEWTDVCGSLNPPKSQAECLLRKHFAFEIDREELGLS